MKRGRPRLVDLTGRVYGLLTVIRRAPSDCYGNTHWFVKCGCGSNEKAVMGGALTRGKTKTCGCSRLSKKGAV